MYILIAPKDVRLILGFCILIAFCGCSTRQNAKATPEQARAFLKLRGYNFDQNSFFEAAKASDEIAVNLFLEAGMYPNTKDRTTSALIAAASRGDLEMVNALLRGRALVNQRDEGNFTALMRALQSKNDEVADVLVAQPGLEVNAQSPTGNTALMNYVGRNREDVVKALLARGADINLKDADGDTALHLASQRGNLNLVRMLVDHGAAPNAKNKVGGTPLMWAGVFGHEAVARLLLEKGADPSLKDNKGMTAAEWATENKRDEIAQFLRTAEKKQ